MNRKNKPLVQSLCALIALLLCLGAPFCAWAEETTASDDTAVWEMLSGKTAGVMTGTPQDKIVLSKVPNAKIQYFNSITDVALALETKKVDFAALPTVSYYTLVQQYENFGYLDAAFAVYDVGTVFSKSGQNENIRLQLNEYIQKLKDNGQLEELQNYWLFPHDWETLDIPESGKNGTLTMATASTLKPFSFRINDQHVGYEVAIIAGFCKEYGYGLKIEDVDFAGILSGISSGQYDLAASQISWTEERGESVDFSDFYYTQKFVPIVNSEDFACDQLITADSATNDDGGDSQSENPVIKSIRRTLIDENRWQSLLQGLLVTLCITAVGFLLANLFGAAFCAMSLSKSKVLKALAEIYAKLMQGLPIVVVLMLLYYVVFGKAKASNILIAMLGFGLVFGAYMAQLFKGGIQSVDGGQWEAALSTGLTKPQTFFGIILPQAVRTMLPGYFSNLISLMKGTAVVGYIAINDLTKVGDIIRSNTYEAIVPLLTIAVLYFLIASILLTIMNALHKRLTAHRRKKPVEPSAQKGDLA